MCTKKFLVFGLKNLLAFTIDLKLKLYLCAPEISWRIFGGPIAQLVSST